MLLQSGNRTFASYFEKYHCIANAAKNLRTHTRGLQGSSS